MRRSWFRQQFSTAIGQPCGRGALEKAAAKATTAFWLTARCSAAASLLFLFACAAPAPLLQRSDDLSGPQWPEPPFEAKIQWIKSVATPSDAGIAKKFWKRALELFAGADKNGIVKPYGVLFDDGGRLFIADPGAGAVHLMETRDGRYSTITGTGEYRLLSPIGLAEDEQGGVFITDSVGNAIYRYDVATRSLTPFLRGLGRPTGIAYNKVNKLLYFSETNYSRVIGVDLQGNQRVAIGASGPGEGLFNRPTDIAVDGKGQVYVTDPLNYRIRVFTPEGTQVREFGSMGDMPGEFNKPKGIAVDREGRIYVCDSLLDAVQVFDDEGEFDFIFGATGTADGAFWMPSGIYINGDYIFVADTFNRRVQIFRYLPGGRRDKNAGSKLQLTSKVNQ